MENERPQNKSRNRFLKRNKNQTNSFKYVKDKGSRDSYLWILLVLNAKDETQTDGKASVFCF
jgi:hypothetical protein